VCVCSYEVYDVSDSLKVQINGTFLYITGIPTEMRYFHPLLPVVFMIATTVQSLNCRL